jgi:WD40 repeat protein
VLLTSGYDNVINVYQLLKRYNDAEHLGKLEGHSSLVTAIACIENSPVAISSDDKYIIKLWDIRTLKCVQSFDLELRQPIGHITALEGAGAVCLVTNRILVIDFENCNFQKS